jgi:hypothetical protein
MNKASKIAVIGVGAFVGIVVIAGIAGGGKPAPTAPATATTSTVTVIATARATPTATARATAAPTATPTPQPTAVPTPEPTAVPVPTPTPTAKPCPSGFHNGVAGDTYSGCYADPTPTPAPACYRLMQVVLDTGQSTIVEIRATGSTPDLACLAADLQSGKTFGSGTLTVVSIDHLASDAHSNCSTTVGGIPVQVFDNGTALSRVFAQTFCQSSG